MTTLFFSLPTYRPVATPMANRFTSKRLWDFAQIRGCWQPGQLLYLRVCIYLQLQFGGNAQ
jgi:hypothetical protein